MKSEIENVKKEFTKKILGKEVEIQKYFAGKLKEKDDKIQKLTENFDDKLMQKDKEIRKLFGNKDNEMKIFDIRAIFMIAIIAITVAICMKTNQNDIEQNRNNILEMNKVMKQISLQTQYNKDTIEKTSKQSKQAIQLQQLTENFIHQLLVKGDKMLNIDVGYVSDCLSNKL